MPPSSPGPGRRRGPYPGMPSRLRDSTTRRQPLSSIGDVPTKSPRSASDHGRTRADRTTGVTWWTTWWTTQPVKSAHPRGTATGLRAMLRTRRVSAHRGRTVAVRGVPEAQLPEEVRAPAVQGAIVADPAGVSGTYRELCPDPSVAQPDR